MDDGIGYAAETLESKPILLKNVSVGKVVVQVKNEPSDRCLAARIPLPPEVVTFPVTK